MTKGNNYRPCLVQTFWGKESEEFTRALFHQWVPRQDRNERGDVYYYSVALIEREDGTLTTARTNNLIFLDTQERMAEFTWPGEEHDNL